MGVLTTKLLAAKILGPYFDKACGRYVVNVEYYTGKRSNMTYARFLMQEHLGRVLAEDEHVDHIDENKTNDVVSNLQLLTPVENTIKSNGASQWFVFVCPVCGELATKLLRQVRHNWRLGKAGPFCGRRCAGRFNMRS